MSTPLLSRRFILITKTLTIFTKFMLLRFEKKEDIKGIHSVHVESFETDQEAKLVDDLRLGDLDLISLVAEENQKIIGHLLFSPVFLDSNIKIKMMGLAPLAILPTYQNRGIGTLLVSKGLDVCVQKKYNLLWYLEIQIFIHVLVLNLQ